MAGAGPPDFDPFSRAFVTDPYPLLATMRREAAVHYGRQPNPPEPHPLLRHRAGPRAVPGGREGDGGGHCAGWTVTWPRPPHRPDAAVIRSTADQAIRAYLATLIQAKAEGGAGDDLAARLVSRWRQDPAQVSEAELMN